MAKSIAHALEAKRPRSRYLVGLDAKVQARIEPLIPTAAVSTASSPARWGSDPRAHRPAPSRPDLYWAQPIDWSISQRHPIRRSRGVARSRRTAQLDGDKASEPRQGRAPGRAPPPPTAPSWSRCRRSGTCWPAGEELAAGAEPLDGPSLDRRPRLGARARHPPARRQRRRARPRRKAFNTSVLIGPDGEDLAVYRKIHMFDVDVGGVSYRESEHEQPGDGAGRSAPSASSPSASASVTTCASPSSSGSSPCAAPDLLAVPSAFTSATGRDHWEVLLRARAIENQAFVLAPNQVGTAPPHYDSCGHSAIVDPWGRLLAVAPARRVLRRRRPRPRRAGAGPRVAALARQPPPRRLRLAAARGGARLMAQGPAGRQAPPDPRRRGPRLRPPGLPRDPRLRHRRRGRGRLRPRLPLLPLEGRGPERALRRALVAAARGDRGDRPGRRRRTATSSARSPASSSTPTATTRS